MPSPPKGGPAGGDAGLRESRFVRTARALRPAGRTRPANARRRSARRGARPSRARCGRGRRAAAHLRRARRGGRCRRGGPARARRAPRRPRRGRPPQRDRPRRRGLRRAARRSGVRAPASGAEGGADRADARRRGAGGRRLGARRPACAELWQPVARPVARSRAGDLAAIVYTSGSTGAPKGAAFQHRGLRFAARAIAGYLGLTGEDRILSALPLSHIYGLSQLLVAVRSAATLVLEQGVAFPGRLVTALERERISVLPGVPTLWQVLLGLQGLRERELGGLRVLTNAGAALPPARVAEVRRLFPRARLFAMYGQTECNRVCWLAPEELDARPASVGVPLPGTDVWIEDGAGRRVAPGETGELVVRGPHVMQGYWNDPVASARKLRPGRRPSERVLRTGDLFRTDADGYLHFVARGDDIIKCRGEKVAPAEVEAALLRCAGVREAAVVGVEDELLGQAVVAHVSGLPGARARPPRAAPPLRPRCWRATWCRGTSSSTTSCPRTSTASSTSWPSRRSRGRTRRAPNGGPVTDHGPLTDRACAASAHERGETLPFREPTVRLPHCPWRLPGARVDVDTNCPSRRPDPTATQDWADTGGRHHGKRGQGPTDTKGHAEAERRRRRHVRPDRLGARRPASIRRLGGSGKLYIEAFPTSPLILNPFNDQLPIPKALAPIAKGRRRQLGDSAASARQGRTAWPRTASGAVHEEVRADRWAPTRCGPRRRRRSSTRSSSRSPGHKFTSSSVQPIDSHGKDVIPPGSKDSKPRKLPESTIYGFNGTFPGPRINAEYHKPLLVRFENHLGENNGYDRQDFGAPNYSFLTHLHNGHTAPESDGNPHYAHHRFGPLGPPHARGGLRARRGHRPALPRLPGGRRRPREAVVLLVPRPRPRPHRRERLQGHGRADADLRPEDRQRRRDRPEGPAPARAAAGTTRTARSTSTTTSRWPSTTAGSTTA